MDKIYIVRYIDTKLGKTGIWGVYSDPDKAEDMVAYIDTKLGWPAWWNEEVVQ